MHVESDVSDGEVGGSDGEPREYGWSVDLELQEHADDRDRVVREANATVEQTMPGDFVNLVTHEAHGHPEAYLQGALRDGYGGAVAFEDIDQCGCGGPVTCVHVE